MPKSSKTGAFGHISTASTSTYCTSGPYSIHWIDTQHCTVRSTAIDPEVQAKIDGLFTSIDTDQSGSLELAELKIFFQVDGANLPRVLELMDADQNGIITKTEWQSFFVQLHGRGLLDGSLKLLTETRQQVQSQAILAADAQRRFTDGDWVY